jgi:hypothetical protein
MNPGMLVKILNVMSENIGIGLYISTFKPNERDDIKLCDAKKFYTSSHNQKEFKINHYHFEIMFEEDIKYFNSSHFTLIPLSLNENYVNHVKDRV